MADTNGHAKPRLSEEELRVLELLPRCSAAFIGWLAVSGLRDVQREARLVRPTGEPEPDASRVAGRPPGA